MKKITKIFLFMMTLVALCFALTSGASAKAIPSRGTCGTNVFYTYDSTSKELVISGTGAISDYQFDEYQGAGTSPFFESDVRTIIIKNGITSIGKWVFIGCDRLTTVSIPDSVVSIEPYAFLSCNALTSVTIPGNVKSIGTSAFASCSELTSITISDGVTTIGESVFSRCEALTSITFPDSVTSIGDFIFEECENLSSVTLPEKLESIGNAMFYNCTGLTGISLPDTITSIAGSSFYGCSNLTSITLPDSLASIGASAFYGCSSLTSITISDNLTSIGASAFYGCRNLTSITIPDSLTTIGKNAFYNCNRLENVYAESIEGWLGITFNGFPSYPLYYGKNLYFNGVLATEITIPDSVKTLKNLAFYNCGNLTSVTIPDSVESIGESAFAQCENLESITISDNITSIGASAFYNCSKLKSITLPDSVTSIGKDAFSGCSGLTDVYAESVAGWSKITFGTIYSNPMFYGKNLYFGGALAAEITIPDSITAIGNWAFYDCDNITSITIADSVKTIGNSAFEACDNLRSAIIGNNVTSIGDSAFAGCYSLTEVTTGNNIKTIGNMAFSFCTSLKNITIPDSVTSIGYKAFEVCTSLVSIKIPHKVASIEPSTFFSCSNLKNLTLGNGISSIGHCAFKDCSSLTSITLPDGVALINDSVFEGCTNLTSVTIPNNVSFIGSEMSSDCKNLEIYYKGTKEEWASLVEYSDANWRFSHMESLSLYYFPSYSKLHFCTALVTEPSYSENGSIKYICTDCDSSLIAKEIPATDKHTYKAVVTAPTCIKDGYTTYTCDCGEGYVTNEVDVLGHSFTKYISDNNSTFTADGTKTAKCDRCTVTNTIADKGSKLTLGKTAKITVIQNTNAIKLTWSAVKNAVGYAVYQKIGGKWTKLGDRSVTNATIKNLQAGTKYEFAIKAAAKINGKVIWSDTYTTIKTATQAIKPVKVAAAQNTSAIKITWTACPGATGYRIYYKSGSNWKVTVSTTSAISHTFTGLKAGAKFTFAVRPYIKTDSSVVWSDYTTYTATTAPDKVTVKANPASTDKISLSWNTVNGAESYNVYYSLGNDSFKLYKTASKNTKSLIVSGLKTNTKYTFAVRANISTTGGVVRSDYTTYTSTTTPATVTAKATSPSTGKINLSWNLTNGADGYNVYYKVGNGSYKLYKTVKGINSLTFSGLKSGTKYTFAVRAGNSTSGGAVWGGYKTSTVTVK